MKKIIIFSLLLLMLFPCGVYAKSLNDYYNELAKLQAEYNANKNNKQMTEAETALKNLKNEDGTLKVNVSEKDYENALSFYNDPKNYSYHCILGVDSNTQSKKRIELTDVDTSKFNSLLDFADKSNYDPFDKKHNAKIDKVELPMPDDTKDTRLVFYKQSKDDLFVSSTGTDYYIIGGHLYAVYQYDFGHGEYEKLIAVKVPDEISTYFVEYMKSYL